MLKRSDFFIQKGMTENGNVIMANLIDNTIKKYSHLKKAEKVEKQYFCENCAQLIENDINDEVYDNESFCNKCKLESLEQIKDESEEE